MKTSRLFFIFYVFCQDVSANVKHVIFIRHGEAEHNVLIRNQRKMEAYALRDPSLTSDGVAQAKNLAQMLKSKKIDVVLTSPLTRALNTTLIAFQNLDIPIVVEPGLAEHGYYPCDLGSDGATLQELYPRLNFSALTNGWNLIESPEAFKKRVEGFSTVLSDREEKNIAIVSHGGLIKELTKKNLNNCEIYELDWEL